MDSLALTVMSLWQLFVKYLFENCSLNNAVVILLHFITFISVNFDSVSSIIEKVSYIGIIDTYDIF